MATLKFISLPILVILCTIVNDCESFPPVMLPNLPGPAPYSPSYGSMPGPPAKVAPPTYYSPEPATPTYLPAPGPDTYPQVPASPASLPGPVPDPYAPAPYSYPPISSPEPQSPSYHAHPVHPSRGIRAAYWPSFNEFPASSIETSYFTHLYYAFLLPEPITFKLNVTQVDLIKMPEFMDALRTHNPPVKTLLSIGGGGNNATVFSQMASTELTRASFIDSTIEVARTYGFDGVDLDWEFPENDQDMSNLALLFKQWRNSLNHEAKISGKPRLLITSAVYFASKFTTYGEPRSYPVDAIRKYLDWVSPMCFDYHGSWDNFTGPNAALYDPNSDINTDFGIGSWIQAGIPPRKLVMGLPLYGKTWKLKDPNLNGIGAPALGVGPGGGILTYNQIVEFNRESNATVIFDFQTVSHYSYAGDTWVGYDDIQSVKMKIHFALSRRLGGYFFWAIGQDKDWTISRQASNAWGH